MRIDFGLVRRVILGSALLVLVFQALTGCAGLYDYEQRSVAQALPTFARPTEVPFPLGNRFSSAKADLGRALFFDTRLSGGNAMACASCHDPRSGFDEARPTALGETGAVGARNTPTLWNIAWAKHLFWDGRAESLEAQALGPVTAPGEMNQGLDDLVAELAQDAAMRERFVAVFADGITADTIAAALATYERTLLSPRTAFDRWQAGEATALSAEEARGFALFVGKAGCATCHSGWRFTDDAFHDIGLPTHDEGRGAIDAKLRHAFKTPTLRGVAARAPYMHDGSMPQLERVVEYYTRGVQSTRKTKMRPVELDGEERRAIVAFLRTL